MERQKWGEDDRSKEGIEGEKGRDDSKCLLCEPHSLVVGHIVCFWAATHSDLAEADNDFPGGDPG